MQKNCFLETQNRWKSSTEEASLCGWSVRWRIQFSTEDIIYTRRLLWIFVINQPIAGKLSVCTIFRRVQESPLVSIKVQHIYLLTNLNSRQSRARTIRTRAKRSRLDELHMATIQTQPLWPTAQTSRPNCFNSEYFFAPYFQMPINLQ